MRLLALERGKWDILVILKRPREKNYCADDIILDIHDC